MSVIDYTIECASWLKLVSAYLIYILEVEAMSAESDALRAEVNALVDNLNAVMASLDAAKAAANGLNSISEDAAADKAAMADLRNLVAEMNAKIQAGI